MITAKTTMHMGRRLSVKHNTDKKVREKQDHIDAAKIKDNIILVNTPFKKFVEETFTDALEQFNQYQIKARHPERQKTMKQLIEEAREGTYEVLAQVGDENTYNELKAIYGEAKTNELYVNLLKDYADNFQKDNPSLRVFCAAIHLDEKTPHLHIDALPCGNKVYGRKEPVSILSIGMEPAMRECGFERSKSDKYGENPVQKWLVKQHEVSYQFFKEEVENKYKVKDLWVLPCEESNSRHKETSQYRQEEAKAAKGKELVNNLLNGEDQIRTAKAIIENADAIKQAKMSELKEESKKVAKDRASLKRVKNEIQERSALLEKQEKASEEQVKVNQAQAQKLEKKNMELKAENSGLEAIQECNRQLEEMQGLLRSTNEAIEDVQKRAEKKGIFESVKSTIQGLKDDLSDLMGLSDHIKKTFNTIVDKFKNSLAKAFDELSKEKAVVAKERDALAKEKIKFEKMVDETANRKIEDKIAELEATYAQRTKVLEKKAEILIDREKGLNKRSERFYDLRRKPTLSRFAMKHEMKEELTQERRKKYGR